MMDGPERKQLLVMPGDATQDLHPAPEKLAFADLLLLLLRENETVRALIHDIATAAPVSATSAVHESDEVADRTAAAGQGAALPQPPGAESFATPVDTLRAQLAPELTLLKLVQADADIGAEWLGEQTGEGRQLLQLVACVAQWDMLSDLWDRLANRCRQQQRMASADEMYILKSALELHNLRWRGRQARLADVAAGTAYDYERHQRGTPTGERVFAQWLPGLVNAGGQLQKKALVQT